MSRKNKEVANGKYLLDGRLVGAIRGVLALRCATAVVNDRVAVRVGLRVLAYACVRLLGLPRLLLLLRERLPRRLLLRRCLRPAIVLTSHFKPPLRVRGRHKETA
ncbi:hypothetical protein [Adlercreutzia sp. ZJ138]|uniref:hypothetical protein n=1 Tax=Adlercreutzia sp. ZJ138 TaxID=2709405 RepID=UPI0013E9B0F3|nr:hypothetical protein [Adlercreutzia sp. ZJ138]